MTKEDKPKPGELPGNQSGRRKEMPLTRIFFLLLCIILLSGCGTKVKVTVDSIRDPQRDLPGEKYVMVSGMPEVSRDNLYFREFSRYFQEILRDKGYAHVDDRQEADLEISLSYGISEGKNIYSTYHRPIYDFTGGETIVYTETRSGKTGQPTEVTGTIHIPTRNTLIGYVEETAARTVHTSFVILEASHLSGKREKKTLWKTTLKHTSEISDLRRLMPYFAAAAKPYLSGNTQIARTIKLKPSDLTFENIRLPDTQ